MSADTMRRTPTVVVTVVVLVVLSLGSIVAVRMLSHPRDLPAFRAYLQTYMGQNLPDGPDDLAWASDHPGQVQAEADSSCEWLGRQPFAPQPVDPTGFYARDSLEGRYLAATRDHPQVSVSDQGRSMIVAGAWTFLCPDDVFGRVAPRHLPADD